jgi:hypothetical protein
VRTDPSSDSVEDEFQGQVSDQATTSETIAREGL